MVTFDKPPRHVLLADPDETDGRALYRAKADKMAWQVLSYARRKVKLRATVALAPFAAEGSTRASPDHGCERGDGSRSYAEPPQQQPHSDNGDER